MINQYLIHLLILIEITYLLASSFQISAGFTGIFNLGHIAFYALGAYTSALLVKQGFSFGLALIGAGIFAAVLGYFLARSIRKLSGSYLTLVTMGFLYLTQAILLNWKGVTGGPVGIPGIPRPLLLGFRFRNNFQFLLLTTALVALCHLLITRIVRSPFGKVMESIRDDELAAQSLGKNVEKTRATSLIISAFFAGIAGSLYAHYMSYISPTSFSMNAMMPIMCIALVGGLASLKGTFLATAFIMLVPEAVRFIGFPPSVVGPVRQIIYAAILLLFLLYKPKGLFGKVRMGQNA